MDAPGSGAAAPAAPPATIIPPPAKAATPDFTAQAVAHYASSPTAAADYPRERARLAALGVNVSHLDNLFAAQKRLAALAQPQDELERAAPRLRAEGYSPADIAFFGAHLRGGAAEPGTPAPQREADGALAPAPTQDWWLPAPALAAVKQGAAKAGGWLERVGRGIEHPTAPPAVAAQVRAYARSHGFPPGAARLEVDNGPAGYIVGAPVEGLGRMLSAFGAPTAAKRALGATTGALQAAGPAMDFGLAAGLGDAGADLLRAGSRAAGIRAAARIGGGLAGGAIGQQALARVAAALGATADQAQLAGIGGGLLGGVLGERAARGGAGAEIAPRRAALEEARSRPSLPPATEAAPQLALPPERFSRASRTPEGAVVTAAPPRWRALPLPLADERRPIITPPPPGSLPEPEAVALQQPARERVKLQPPVVDPLTGRPFAARAGVPLRLPPGAPLPTDAVASLRERLRTRRVQPAVPLGGEEAQEALARLRRMAEPQARMFRGRVPLPAPDEIGAASRAQQTPEPTTARPSVAAAPAPQERAPIAAARGRETVVKTPGGDVPADYALVEADELQPSHHAGTFAPNPLYPAGVQERDYQGSPEAQARVAEQERNFDPRFLLNTNPDAVNGPPMVTPDGTVLGGNSRAMTAQRVYAAGRGDEYKKALAADAGHFGLDPARVRAMRKPVLVRVMPQPGDIETMRRLGSDLNRNFTGALGPAELAASRGRSVSPETLGMVAAHLDRDPTATLRSLLHERPRDVLAALERDGVITARERPGLVDQRTGQLSGEGKQLAERAMLGAVVPDGKTLLMSPPAETNKVAGALAPLAAARAEGGDWDLTPALDAALRLRARMAAEGLSADDVLAQRDLLGENQADARTAALTRALGRTARRFRSAAQEFAQLARRARGGQGDMFGAPTSAEEAFQASFGARKTPHRARDYRRETLTEGKAVNWKPERQGPGTIWIGSGGEKAFEALDRRTGNPGNDGFALNGREAWRQIEWYRSHWGDLAPEERDLARAMKAAYDSGDGHVVVIRAGADPATNEKIAVEEDAHVMQGVLGGGDAHALLTPEEAEALLRDPQLSAMAKRLGYGHGSDPQEAMAEVGARLVARNWEELGVSADVGENLRDRYRHLILSKHGQQIQRRGRFLGPHGAGFLQVEGEGGEGSGDGAQGAGGGRRKSPHRQRANLPERLRGAYRRLPEDARVILGQLRGEQDPLLAERFPTLAEAARLARVARHAVPPTTEALIRAAFSEFNPEETEHAGQVLLLRRQAEELERAAAAAHAFAAENGDEGTGEQAANLAEQAAKVDAAADEREDALTTREAEAVARYRALNERLLRPLAVDAGVPPEQLYDDYYHYVFRDFNDRLAKSAQRGKRTATAPGGRRLKVRTAGPARRSSSGGRGADLDLGASARGALNELRGQKVVNDFVRYVARNHARALRADEGLTPQERAAGQVIWQPNVRGAKMPAGFAPRYAMDPEVARMLNDFAGGRGEFEGAALRAANWLAHAIKVGRVGLGTLGVTHQLNLVVNPLMEGGRASLLPGRDIGARARIAGAQFDMRLRRELLDAGAEHPDIRELLRLGAMDPWQLLETTPTAGEVMRRGGPLNPRVGHERLFGFGGADTRTRVQALREYRRMHPERAATGGRIKDAWTRDAYRYVAKLAGDYNPANYSTAQKYAAPLVGFFGWDKATYPSAATFVLRHATEAAGLYLGTRLLSHALGGAWMWSQPGSMAVGRDRQGNIEALSLPSQLGKTGRVAGALAELAGGHPQRAARTAFDVTSPLVTMPVEAAANERYPLTGSPQPVVDADKNFGGRARDLAAWGGQVFGPYDALEQVSPGSQTLAQGAAGLAGVYLREQSPLRPVTAAVAKGVETAERMDAAQRRGRAWRGYLAAMPDDYDRSVQALLAAAGDLRTHPPADPTARAAEAQALAREAGQVGRLGGAWAAAALADDLLRGDRAGLRATLAAMRARGIAMPSERALEGAYGRLETQR